MVEKRGGDGESEWGSCYGSVLEILMMYEGLFGGLNNVR
jgi:hypothetical protein